MGTSEEDKVPDDWWPSALSEFAGEKPLGAEYVVVAEISRAWGPNSDKRLFTRLVPKDRLACLMRHRGCIGHEVSTIDGVDREDQFEPLVLSWESVGKTVLMPDQGFLMTYGLMPRQCESGEVLWDDPENRVFDVVKVEPPSEFCYKLLRESRVLIRREYLQDYATVRDMSMVQTYFVANIDDAPDPVSSQLAKSDSTELLLPQRMLDVSFDARDRGRILAQVWGYRHLLDPTDAPVSDDNDYGLLDWPGYGIVDGSKGMRLYELPRACEYVYVKDEVLGEYEGWPGFSISPESGAVSYGGQWNVDHTERIGRDLIQVELKKLYEGNRPKTVKTWYKYRIAPPALDDPGALRRAPNIATRAKAVVYAMVELGEILAEIAAKATKTQRTGRDLVKLDRAELDKHGWWRNSAIEPMTHHAPIEMTEGDFMGRCVDLFKVVGEGLSQKILRKTLKSIGTAEKDIRKLGSLRLLERLTQLAIVAEDTGLELIAQGMEIEERRKNGSPPTPVSVLLQVGALRNSKSHRDADAGQALKELGVCIQKMVHGWGEALDIVYDQTARALSDIGKALKAGLDT